MHKLDARTSRRPRAALISVSTAVITIALGGCGEDSGCPSGKTKACLSDGTTCTCAPSCSSDSDCDRYTLDRGGGQPSESCSTACACATSLCLPLSWHPGESVSFSSASSPDQ